MSVSFRICKCQLPTHLIEFSCDLHVKVLSVKDISMTDSCYQISQTDGSSLFSLEGILSKLCQLALEVEDDDRSRSLRAAGLQALSAMVIRLCCFVSLATILLTLMHSGLYLFIDLADG